MARGSKAEPPRLSAATDRYLELVRACPLRPIASEAELDRAIAVIDGLLDQGLERLSPDEDDYLDVLSDLVESYEKAHDPIPEATPEEMLGLMIESRGLTQAAVAAGSGIAETTLSLVLGGKRKLTRGHIEALAAFFGVEPGRFL